MSKNLLNISRDDLLHEFEIRVAVLNEGVNVDINLLQHLDYDKYLEQIHACFYNNHKDYGSKLPEAFRAPSGYRFPIVYDPRSRFHIAIDGNQYYLQENGENLFEIRFERKPKYYSKLTSNGKRMETIAQYVGSSKITIAYSNECSLLEKNMDCRFCNINATKARYAERQHIEWKTAQEIAETVGSAYDEGMDHMTVTGGFIPERREVDYYIDVAESVQEYLGVADFGGTACIGAPSDLDVIEKYRDAGYDRIATNIEIWNRDLFQYICPGKAAYCGGYENWINALKREVEVFGRGKVRSYFVAGIESKDTLLEGIETLASLGVVAVPQIWTPKPGSSLEGHRAPSTEWFVDLMKKAYTSLVRNGISHKQFYDATNDGGRFFDYLYDLDGDYLKDVKDYRVLA